MDLYQSGYVEIKILQQVAPNSFQGVYECTVTQTKAQADLLAINLHTVSTGYAMYPAEQQPNILSPGIFRVIFKEIQSVLGGAPRFNTPTDCLNSLNPSALIFIGSSKTNYRSYACLDGTEVNAFGRCQPKTALIPGCLANDRDNPSNCAICKEEYLPTAPTDCTPLPQKSVETIHVNAGMCSRCLDGFVQVRLVSGQIVCTAFTPTNFPNSIYIPFLQSVTPITQSFPTPIDLVKTGSRYSHTFTVQTSADESTVVVHIDLQMIADPLVPNVYSHYDVFLSLDGDIIQTKAVPYTVTNFADKKLSIDTISHYTV